jgi:hypothetical protein
MRYMRFGQSVIRVFASEVPVFLKRGYVEITYQEYKACMLRTAVLQ